MGFAQTRSICSLSGLCPSENPPQGAREKVAFTLAEVLITLGIIGVVAAMTLPTVISNVQKRQLKSQFGAAYSLFSQAVMNFATEKGGSLVARYATYDASTDSYPNKQEFYDDFPKYAKFRIAGECKYKDTIKTFDKSQQAVCYRGTTKPKIRLTNGMCYGSQINASSLTITIDINGVSKPNAFGHDVFVFYIDNKDKLMPFKATGYLTEEDINQRYPDGRPNPHEGEGASLDLVGMPCSIKSRQASNGVGCAYYAWADESFDDSSKGFWESLP